MKIVFFLGSWFYAFRNKCSTIEFLLEEKGCIAYTVLIRAEQNQVSGTALSTILEEIADMKIWVHSEGHSGGD